MMGLKTLKDERIIIVTHVFATGPAQELEEFLKDKVRELLFVGHPFSYAQDKRSFFKRYRDGALVEKKYARNWNFPGILGWFKDILYTFGWVLASKGTFKLYVGANNLNAFIGLCLKKIGKVKQVVFYTVDYAPKRFSNKLLNNIYHWLDRYCVEHCDRVWNLSENMVKGRMEKGISNGRQMVVPIGVRLNAAGKISLDSGERIRLVYMGHLRKGQGLELIVEAAPEIMARFPRVDLMVIGMGELKGELKKKAEELGVADRIEFVGYVEDHREVEKYLCSCAVGLAPYEPTPDSFTWYADPSKPKQYMACGLPVIITNVPKIARDVEKKQMGIVVEYAKKDLVEAVTKLLTDREFYLKCRKNALEFSVQLSWDSIFERAFSQTLS